MAHIYDIVKLENEETESPCAANKPIAKIPPYDELSDPMRPPPPLPPRPHMTSETRPCSSPNLSSRYPRPSTGGKFPSTETQSNPMSIRELVEKHQDEFPLEVLVTSGIAEETDLHTFSALERLRIHFMKQVKMVVLERSRGRIIKVPLNSDLQLGVVYDPHDDIKAALNGYEYRTAGDLKANMPLPKVVCAQQTYEGSSPNSSVDKGDILAVNEVKASGKFGGGKFLHCTLLHTNNSQRSKKLAEKCSGSFTTKPASLKLFLPEILNCFDLPIKVITFPTNHSHSNTPLAEGEMVTISKVVNEKAVIATIVNDDDTNLKFEFPMFDIPIDIPLMEVQIMEPKEDDCEKLYEDTRTLFENYKSFKKSREVQIKGGSDVYYTPLIRGGDSEVELVCPKNVYMTATKNAISVEQVAIKQQEIDHLTKTIEALETEMKTLREKIDSSVSVPSIEESPHVPEPVQVEPEGQDEQAKNKDVVRSLSCAEVLTLLERLNMSAYREVFEKEQIDGEVLMECDDEILSTELKVTSRLHRIRLRQFISGQRSVQELIA